MCVHVQIWLENTTGKQSCQKATQADKTQNSPKWNAVSKFLLNLLSQERALGCFATPKLKLSLDTAATIRMQSSAL